MKLLLRAQNFDEEPSEYCSLKEEPLIADEQALNLV
jgi:hypothetical protein